MRFPRVMPAPWYRDPALNERIGAVGGERVVVASVDKPQRFLRVPKDCHYTAWRRLVVRESVRKQLKGA